MAKYRILKREYPNGHIDYKVQKKMLGLFWWNFNNIDAYETGIYDTLEKAKMVIEMNKGTIKKTIININDKESEEAQQHDETEKFYCEGREREVTYRKTCKNCIIASVDEDGYFYCPYYKGKDYEEV